MGSDVSAGLLFIHIPNASFFQILGGKDIIFGNYRPAWRFYRKLFTTALRQYLSDIPLIERRVSIQAAKMVQFMEEQGGKPFDPADCMIRGVADVICGITFKDGSVISNRDLNRLLELNKYIIANANDLQLLQILDFFPLMNYLPFKAYGRIVPYVFEIHDIIRKLLKERIDTFDPAEPVEDLMSSLLRTKHDLEPECDSNEKKTALLSEDYFVAIIEDMFVGGYETTSTTLRFLVAYLANFPKCQEDIQRQLDEVVGNRRPSLDDRPNLPLIQATIFEALRVGNVLPMAVPHLTINDTTLCGYRVPKGTIVFPNTESVHLDAKCWEDSTVFNPYRHIDTDGKLITNQSNFYPFGAGRRVCAGESLARVELFLFLSWLLHKFTFVAEEGFQLEVKGSIVQFPVRYKIRAIKRKWDKYNDVRGIHLPHIPAQYYSKIIFDRLCYQRHPPPPPPPLLFGWFVLNPVMSMIP